MALNQKCPKCGSTHVQLSNVESKHGCLWTILFGWLYLIWVAIKWIIGFLIILCFDWWMAIIKSVQKKRLCVERKTLVFRQKKDLLLP